MSTSRKRLLIRTTVGRLFLLFWVVSGLVIVGRCLYEIRIARMGTILQREGIHYDYLLILPNGYSPADPPRPLLIYLHGSGELHKTLDELTRANLVYYAGSAVRGKDFPFIVACPKEDGPVWEPERVVAFLDELLDHPDMRHRIDPNRIYLTGFSLGGYGTWQTAALYPDRFAAVVPVAGDCYPNWATSYGNLPIWAFHGANDEIVPPKSCIKTMDSLRELRGWTPETRLTLYLKQGHDIARRTYGNAELYRWLLKYRCISSDKNKDRIIFEKEK